MLCTPGSFFFSRIQAQNQTLYNTPQAPNFDFEVWENPEPWGWNSSSCFEAGHSASQQKRNQSVWSSTDIPAQSKGSHSVYIKVTQSSWYRYKVPIGTTSYADMGTLTTGTLYYYDEKENASSCIYTHTGDGSKRWPFNGRPDSIVFWAKTAANGNRNSDMTLYLHKDEMFGDFNPNGVKRLTGRYSVGQAVEYLSTASTSPIGSANYKIPANRQWTRYSVPISYQSEENPAYLLLSFTAGNNFREVVEGDELWIDDVKLIYNPILSIDTATPLQVPHHGNQSVTINLPYTFYSGTQDPLNASAQNQLRVYLSDENGSFDNKRLLSTANVNGGDNIKHQGHISITLPADLPDSDKYRVRIEASNYSLQSNIIELNIYKQWYLTINQSSQYGTTNAVYRQLCRNGSQQTAIATVNNAECRFLRWEEGGKTVEDALAEYTFNITRDRDLTAIFDTTFTLRFAETVGADPYFENNNAQEITLLNGETLKVRARIKEGYVFQGFRLDPVTVTQVNREDDVVGYDWSAGRGGTIYVLTDSIPYQFEFTVVPDAKLGTASGSGTYKHFSTVTATAEPKEPKQYSHFLHWEDAEGNMVGSDPVLRLENISRGGSYRAVFEESFFNVKAGVADVTDGYVLQCEQRKADSTYSAFDPTHITLRAVPFLGVGFRWWEVTKKLATADSTFIIEENPYNLTDNTHLDADYEFVAVFDTLNYTLAVSALHGYAEGTGTYMYGANVILRATPDKGYHFARWESGSEVLGTADTLLVKILRDSSIVAVCEPNRYAVKILSNDADLGSVNNPGGVFPYDSVLHLVAEPLEAAEFRYWVVDNDTLANTSALLDFTVSDSCTVLAVFSHVRSHVNLYVSNSLYGKVSGAGIYEWHSPVEIKAEAFPGHRFVCWISEQEDTVSKEPVISIPLIEGDTVLTAVFSANMFKVELQAVGEGKVMFVGEESQTVKDFGYMDFVQVHAVPESGYEFEGWYDKNENLCSPYTQEGFSVNRDTVLRGRFIQQQYTVGLFVWPLDIGVLHGMGRYTGGMEVPISVDGSEGYEFLGWYEADTLVETNLAFTVKLTSDRYFTAKFQEHKFFIDVRADDTAKVDSLFGAGDYQYAYNANVYAYAKQGYEVAAWLNAQGDTVSRLNPYLHDVEGAEQLTAVIRPEKLYPEFTVEPEDAGRVRSGEVFYGIEATATAVPAYGYVFSHWKNQAGEIVSDDPALHFISKGDTSFTAVFDSALFRIAAKPRNPLRGSVTPAGDYIEKDGAYYYKYLSTCELFVEHDLHYDFAGWHNQNGEVVSYQHRWTFTVSGELDVIAWFEPLPVISTLVVEPQNAGRIQYEGGQMLGEIAVLYEDSIRLDIIPAQGMEFNKYILVESEDDTDTVAVWESAQHAFVPQGGRTLTALFDTVEYEVSLKVEPAGSGSAQGDGKYKYSTWADLNAQPDEHYRFYAYMVDGKVLSYDSAYALQVDSTMEVRAVFSPKDYLIKPVSADYNQGGVGGEGMYAYGSTVTLEAFAWSDSVEFAYWSHYEDGRDTASLSAQMSHKVAGDTVLTAFFKPVSHLLKVKVNGKGSVDGEEVYEHGSAAELVAQAEPGYHFTAWQERGIHLGSQAAIRLVMRQNRDIEAVFEPDTFNLSLNPSVEGAQVFGSGVYAYESNANIWIAEMPAGYRFVAWKNASGETVSQEPDFVMPLRQNTDLVAQWQAERYRIDLQLEGEGSVSGAAEYGFGEEALLTATPAEDYRLKAWYCGKNLFSEKDTLSFAVVSDLALTAVFEKDITPVEAYVNRAEGGSISVIEESETADTLVLQAQAKPDYHFAYWSLGDSIISIDQEFETDRATALHTEAHFMPDVLYVELSSTTPEGLSNLSGAGSFYKGETTKLKVTVRQGYEFIGWFEVGSDTPISVQVEDTFTVTRPIKLDARTRKTTNQ